MEKYDDNEDWSALSPEEKNRRLYLKQKELLDTFRATNAISQSQYDRSLRDMKAKMGMEEQ